MLKDFFDIYPFGIERDDFHAARTLAGVFQSGQDQLFFNGRIRSRQEVKIGDFLYRPPVSRAEKLRAFMHMVESGAKRQ